MDDLERAGVVLNAVDETLDALRDKDDPALEEQIATLEEMRAELVRRLEYGRGVLCGADARFVPGRPLTALPARQPIRTHTCRPSSGETLSRRPRAYTAAVDDRAALTQARSMLMLLLATCRQTQIALEAAANALDTELTRDLGAMIERTEHELLALTDKINALPT